MPSVQKWAPIVALTIKRICTKLVPRRFTRTPDHTTKEKSPTMSNLSNLKDAQLINVAKGLGLPTEDAEGNTLPRADILASVEAHNAGKAAPAKAEKAAKEPKAPRAKADPNAPATDPEHKACKTCNTDKPINSYPTTAPRADGRRRGDECRSCRDARVTAKKGGDAAPTKASKATKAPAAKKATKATKATAPTGDAA